jgi:hypothetical protein
MEDPVVYLKANSAFVNMSDEVLLYHEGSNNTSIGNYGSLGLGTRFVYPDTGMEYRVEEIESIQTAPILTIIKASLCAT